MALAVKLKKAAPWIFWAAVFALLIWNVIPSVVPAGSAAPSVRVTLDDGRTFDLTDHRGHVVVLNFWGTFCPPCIEEAPVLSRVHRAIERRGGLVVGIAVDRKPLAELTATARAIGMVYPIAQATDEVLDQFRVETLPTTYVVGPDGRIRKSTVGAVRWESLSSHLGIR